MYEIVKRFPAGGRATVAIGPYDNVLAALAARNDRGDGWYHTLVGQVERYSTCLVLTPAECLEGRMFLVDDVLMDFVNLCIAHGFTARVRQLIGTLEVDQHCTWHSHTITRYM